MPLRLPSALAALTALLTALLVAGSARADLAPDPGPCDHQAVGSACVQPDGTAGVCASHADGRRPGVTHMSCDRDEHECDRLAIGAVCHGYLGHASHCREFTNDRTHARWRACTADPSNYRNSAGDVPAASLAHHACSVSRTVGSAGAGGAVLFAALVAVVERRRSAARARSRSGPRT